jgi:hypothetical protein
MTRRAPKRGKPAPALILNGNTIVPPAPVEQRERRPCEFTEAIGEALVAWLEEGRSTRSFCEREGINISSVYVWHDRYPAWAARVAQARERGALAVVELAHDEAVKPRPLEEVQNARLIFDARRWYAAKLNPQYSDKLNVKADVNGSLNVAADARVLLGILSDPAKFAERLPNLSEEQFKLLQSALPALAAAPLTPDEGENV